MPKGIAFRHSCFHYSAPNKWINTNNVWQALSEQWKSLGEEERALYYREQDHLKELHKLQHPDYKFSPRSGRPPRSPAPVSPNQPPEAPEERLPNQPPHHGSVSPAIQVTLCSYLENRRGGGLPR